MRYAIKMSGLYTIWGFQLPSESMQRLFYSFVYFFIKQMIINSASDDVYFFFMG